MQTIKDIIRESGLKATPQRLAIYQTMRDLGHASADAVEEAIKEKCPVDNSRRNRLLSGR